MCSLHKISQMALRLKFLLETFSLNIYDKFGSDVSIPMY